MKHVHFFEVKNEASVYFFSHFSANENMAKNQYKIHKRLAARNLFMGCGCKGVQGQERKSEKHKNVTRCSWTDRYSFLRSSRKRFYLLDKTENVCYETNTQEL